MEQEHKDAGEYDRELRRKIDWRTEQRAFELVNRRMTSERKLKARAKRANVIRIH